LLKTSINESTRGAVPIDRALRCSRFECPFSIVLSTVMLLCVLVHLVMELSLQILRSCQKS